MPDAVKCAIADAVVAHLNAQTYSQEITAARSWANWTSEELTGECAERLHVDVVPLGTGDTVSLEVRTKARYIVTVDVAIRQRLGADKQDRHTGKIDDANVDALVLLTEEITTSLQAQRLEEFPGGVHMSTEPLVNPHRMHLTKWRQFTGVIRVKFRATRALT